MGYIKHKAIIVTDSNKISIEKVHRKCKKIIENYLKKVEFKHCYVPMLTEIVKSVCNGFYSFMIATDGSKEGWEVSNDMKDVRKDIINYLISKQIEYAYITYGGDSDDKTIE